MKWKLWLFALLALAFSPALAKTKLVLASWGSQEEIAAYQKAIQAFQAKNPDLEVEYINIPSSEYLAKVTTMFAAGTAPDVLQRLADVLKPADGYVVAQDPLPGARVKRDSRVFLIVRHPEDPHWKQPA